MLGHRLRRPLQDYSHAICFRNQICSLHRRIGIPVQILSLPFWFHPSGWRCRTSCIDVQNMEQSIRSSLHAVAIFAQSNLAFYLVTPMTCPIACFQCYTKVMVIHFMSTFSKHNKQTKPLQKQHQLQKATLMSKSNLLWHNAQSDNGFQSGLEKANNVMLLHV